MKVTPASTLPARVWRRAKRQSTDAVEFARLQKSLLRKTTTSISFCTAVMDRFEHLASTFVRNVEDNIAHQNCDFVLLNYNCPDVRTNDWARTELMPYIEMGRVNYYYYPDATLFDRSHARNLAFRLAQGEILCNVDADNFVGRQFAHYVSAALSRHGFFLRGPRDGRGLAGRIAVRKTDFDNVSGYDERFRGWCAEDGDLCNRLMMTGIRKRSFHLERFCGSILHGRDLRTAHHSEDISTSIKYNTNLKQANLENQVIRPNGSSFGSGRVQVNFGDWISLP